MNCPTISGQIVDVVRGRIFSGTIHIGDGRVRRIVEEPVDRRTYLIPGFVDAHIHIESSLLIPSEFARLAVVHGTVATVSDPHEIANVLGADGVAYMIRNGETVPLKFYFGAPSCVPATAFETAGAAMGRKEVEALLERPEILYLSEMMNFPGVIAGDPEVLGKIEAARQRGKPVDGHCPGLRGDKLRQYAAAGISTDHESFELAEAREKIAAGMKIAIREGSAARNFDALEPLLRDHSEKCFFCSDDLHVDGLISRHIDALVRRAVARGHDPMAVLRCATLNPVRHYNLSVGLLQEGDPADLLEVSDLKDLKVLRTFIDGRLVARAGESLIESVRAEQPNRFERSPCSPADFAVTAAGPFVRVIEALDRQLITRGTIERVTVQDGRVVADPDRDILKIAVVNRYESASPAVGFIRNFGFRAGALASSVAHDSHNIVAVGATDQALCEAVNLVIETRGGLAVVDEEGAGEILPLPVAGLMSAEDGFGVARRYMALENKAKSLGTPLAAPFMTLSFMALLVIPALKMSDRGLFDGENFSFVPLFADEP